MKFEKGFNVIPFIIAFSILGPISSYILSLSNENFRIYFKVSFIAHWTILELCDGICFYMLLQKINLMLEYRPHLKRTLFIQTTIAFLLGIIGNSVFLAMGILNVLYFFEVRAYIISLQVLLVVDFYRYLVKDISQRQTSLILTAENA